MPRGWLTTDFKPPKIGAVQSEAAHLLPPEAVPADRTQNVVMRDGWLVNRPGLTQITGTVAPGGGRPVGALYFRQGASIITILGTTTGWYQYANNAWTDLTGGVPLTGTADQPIRFVLWPTGTIYSVLGVNGSADNPKNWPGTGTYADLAGSPPKANDITVSANRVILGHTYEGGVEQLYRVRWSGFNDHTSWPATNYVDLSDSEDQIIAVRDITRTSFVIHKEQSQWIGRATSGLFPYIFNLQDHKPGPVSPSALVHVQGIHWWLANDGSIYTFDGSTSRHVGESIRRFVITNLDWDHKGRAFALYLRRDRTIWFFFPSTTGSGDCNAAVSVNIDTLQFFQHVFSQSLSAGTDWDVVSNLVWLDHGAGIPDLTPFASWTALGSTYASWSAMIASATPVAIAARTDGKLYIFGIGSTDDGTAVAAKWRFGPMAPTGRPSFGGFGAQFGTGQRCRVESLDTFFEKTTQAQNVLVQIGTTDTLAANPTFPAALQSTFDISTDSLNQAKYAATSGNVGTGTPEARFIAVEHQITTTTDWRWAGAVLKSYGLETDS